MVVPLSSAATTLGGFFGAPFGPVAKGPSALLQWLAVTRYACAPAPSSWPLGHWLKVLIRAKHCTRSCAVQLRNTSQGDTPMTWQTPAFCEIRLGFEVTAYVYVR